MTPTTHPLVQGTVRLLAALGARAGGAGGGPAGFAGRLARGLAQAPVAQRGLALGAALAVLALTSGSSKSVGTYLWIAALVGGGITLMGLPRALGWSAQALFRVSALALGSGLLAITVLTSVLPAEPAQGEQFRFAVAIGAMLTVVLPHALALVWPRLALVAGPITATAWTTTTVFAGTALLLLGLTWPVWPALQSPADGMTRFLILIGLWTGPLQAAMTLTLGLGLTAFLAWRFEAKRGVGGAGRVLALRSALVRGGGLMVGGAVALLAVPGLEGAARRAAFGTPLEGIAPVAGALAGVLVALAAAGIFFALPGVLARGQLSGRISASAAGESAWLAAGCTALALVTLVAREVLQALVALPGGETDLGVSFGLSPGIVLTAALMVLAHAAVQLALGRPAGDGQPGIPLWLVLPGAEFSPAALATASQAARGWDAGPVTLLAPPAAAPRTRGPHLRLAQQAGSLADLFARDAADAAAWQRALPEAGDSGAPPWEAYCKAPAAAALLAGLPPEARVLVLADGPLAPGWAQALADLPPRSLRVARTERSIPRGAARFFPTKDPAGWREYDFARAGERGSLLTGFRFDHLPREAFQRRILILHGEADRALAERLAGLLEGQTDAAGRQVLASTLAPPVSQGAPLGWSARTWGTLWAFFLRSVDQGEYGPLRRALLRAFVDLRAEDRAARLDLVVVEFGVPRDQAQRLGGPERWADGVLALCPAAPPADAGLLYDAATYTARLTLPPPSALAAMLPIVAEEILNEAYGERVAPTREHAAAPAGVSAPSAGSMAGAPPPESAAPAPGSSSADTPPLRIFISHSHAEPARGVAVRLREALESRLEGTGSSIFLDNSEPPFSIEGGRPTIERALAEASHFVFLASHDYWVSAWHRDLQAAVQRFHAETRPQLLCAIVDALPDSWKSEAVPGDLRILGPFDSQHRMTPLASQDEAHSTIQLEGLADRIASLVLAGPPSRPARNGAVLGYVREYAPFGERLELALRARGIEVFANVGLLEGEARALYLSRMLVVLAGPATLSSEFAAREIDIAQEYGLRIVPVLVDRFETTFALRELVAVNQQYLATLDSDALREEIERSADAIAELMSAPMASADAANPIQRPA